MGWPNFLYNQTDLAKICQHWPTRISEFHPQNTLYGHNLALKEYAGLPEDEPLPWVIEHAITYGKPEPYFAHVQSCLPLILAVNGSQAEILRCKSKSRVEAIGSTFFYTESLFRQRHPGLLEAGGGRRGTIVFPSKSSKNEDWDFDSATFARQLADLPEEFQPVAVSVFWRDFERGVHRAFEDAGLLLVSAGNQEDPDFLFRYLDLCRHFKYSCANQLSTSFCYSVLSGCHFFYWPSGAVAVTRDGESREYQTDPTLNLPGKLKCAAASPFPPTADREVQRKLAGDFAGEDCIRPPEFFRELFEAGNKMMRGMLPVSVLLEPVELLDRLALWQPRAIDNDGWAQERAGFVIPHREGQAGVRLQIEVPDRSDPHWEAEWSMAVDGFPPCFWRVRAGHYVLEVPSPGPNERRSVWMHSTDAVSLSKEARKRCFRVTAIEWIESLAEEPFSWGFRKSSGGEHVAVKQPVSICFDKVPMPTSDLASWLLEGVDKKGRFSGRCGFTVPFRRDQAGVRVKFRLGEKNTLRWRGQMRVRFGDGEGAELDTEISGGSWYLEVPVCQDGCSRKVQLVFLPGAGNANDEIGVLPDFRLRQLTWLNTLAVTKLAGPEQMKLRQLKDLKRLASQARSKTRPSWLRFLPGWIRNRR